MASKFPGATVLTQSLAMALEVGARIEQLSAERELLATELGVALGTVATLRDALDEILNEYIHDSVLRPEGRRVLDIAWRALAETEDAS